LGASLRIFCNALEMKTCIVLTSRSLSAVAIALCGRRRARGSASVHAHTGRQAAAHGRTCNAQRRRQRQLRKGLCGLQEHTLAPAPSVPANLW
jgi:hypothetical protein